jgi:hypothetical protein
MTLAQACLKTLSACGSWPAATVPSEGMFLGHTRHICSVEGRVHLAPPRLRPSHCGTRGADAHTQTRIRNKQDYRTDEDVMNDALCESVGFG